MTKPTMEDQSPIRKWIDKNWRYEENHMPVGRRNPGDNEMTPEQRKRVAEVELSDEL